MTDEEFKKVTYAQIGAMSKEEFQEYLDARDAYYNKHPFACRHCVFVHDAGCYVDNVTHKWVGSKWMCRKSGQSIDPGDPSCENFKHWKRIAR